MRELRGGVFVDGQIDAMALQRLADSGICSIVNNRLDDEQPGQPTSAEMQAAADAAGLRYRHLPVSQGLDLETVAAAREALGQEGGVLFYCRSGMRSALLWAAACAADGEDLHTILAATANAGFDFRPYTGMLRDVAEAFRAG